MEEKAAGKLTESAERPGSLGDSTEEYVPARWTRKKIALTAAIGVVAAGALHRLRGGAVSAHP